VTENELPDTPYQGLMPYTEEDAPFFFGREREQRIIAANMLASRLTLLYGQSGVGKSSVLRAGVAWDLWQRARQNLERHGRPRLAVVVFNAWRDDPVADLGACVRESVARALDGAGERSAPAARDLAEMLRASAEQVGGSLLIILDQFEEYFLYHEQSDGEGTFAVEFPRAANQRDLPANFLISIREDALAKLDRFKGRVPNLFDNYLRVEHLTREAARAAIEKPIDYYNSLSGVREAPVELEPALMDAVLEQVKTGRVVLGATGRGAVSDDSGERPQGDRIETPFLQLVMTRLWKRERSAGSRLLRLQTLNDLGGAERIVRTHLDEAMAALPPGEQAAAARIFDRLVTPSGSKIAHSVSDLAAWAEMPEARLTPMLKNLSSGDTRLLRSVDAAAEQPTSDRYEIFHDVLAPAVLDWRARYVQAEQQRKARWRLLAGILGIALVLAIAAGVVIWRAQAAARQQQEIALLTAIRLGNNAQIRAQRDLNPGPLETIFAGEELENQRRTIDLLKESNAYAISLMDDQEFGPITISGDGSRAEVRVTEDWANEFFEKGSGRCLLRRPRHRVPQTVSLETKVIEGQARWFITRIKVEAEGDLPDTDCDGNPIQS
jgi:type II secretory pathway pseudopilin PulG